ncbi:MAG TPA: protein kinase [Tepidisphaeraceae bacterium]|jgi:serine/threonine protein kinase/tetratricopeptide (TPR) repeat protein
MPDPPDDLTVDVNHTAPTAAIPRLSHHDPEAIGPFRILERVGEGGMGVIYKAEQRSPVRRVVALKVIKLGMDTREVLARFEAERQALALMSHPNIARVLDAGMTEAGRPFFAMEFVAGVPLTRYCDENRLRTRQRLELFVQVCQAVQHAHQKGIIHRDLKPSNILVTMVDGKPVPKVIDFGIAKATNQALTAQTLYTQTGALIGTPEYMSPEQAQTSGLDVDTRTDIYSLGVILYELLTGTTPIDAKELRTAGIDGMARMIRELEPQRPSTRLVTAGSTDPSPAKQTRVLERELRGDLDWIVLKAMERDRTRRYESAAALADDVGRHLDNQPVLARPPSVGYRVEKFVRRHRAGVIGASAVVAALILGMIGTAVGLIRAREQRDLAVEQRKATELARENEKTANLFLRDLLISFGNPAEGRSGVPRAVARLDQGWLKEQPETQAACRILLGSFFIQENEIAQAERQYDTVMALSRRPDGTVPPEISGVIHSGRGMALWMRKQLPEAERELRTAIDDFRKVPGMGARLAQLLFGLSAVRQAQGDKAEAQRLLREATEIAAAEPTMRGYVPGTPAARGGTAPAAAPATALSEGRFDDAKQGYLRACLDDPDNHWNWYHLACLQLYLDDQTSYRNAAKGMFDRFGNTPIATIGERTAKVCLLTPQPVGDMARLQGLLDQALASTENPDNAPWFALSKSLAEYRASRFESALAFVDRAEGLKPASARATMDLIRAMAQHRLGRADKAKELLGKAVSTMEELPKPGAEPIDGAENWLICHILRREAEQLIAGAAKKTPGTKGQ